MDPVDPADGVFITAEGLLMYLQPERGDGADHRVRQAVSRWPDDLRPAAVLVRPWTRRGMRTSLRYRVPPMPFSLSVADSWPTWSNSGARGRAVHDLPMPPGARAAAQRRCSRPSSALRLLDPLRPSLTLLEFG